jgi:hypothetical protein
MMAELIQGPGFNPSDTQAYTETGRRRSQAPRSPFYLIICVKDICPKQGTAKCSLSTRAYVLCGVSIKYSFIKGWIQPKSIILIPLSGELTCIHGTLREQLNMDPDGKPLRATEPEAEHMASTQKFKTLGFGLGCGGTRSLYTALAVLKHTM